MSEQEQEIKIKAGIHEWGQQINFKTEGGRDTIEKQLIPLIKIFLNFLKQGTHVQITNKEVSGVFQKVFESVYEDKANFIDYYKENVKGFCEEISEQVEYQDDESYSKIVVDKWVKIKYFLYWFGYFFQTCYTMDQAHKLYKDVFVEIVEPYYFKQHEKNLFQCITNLIEVERKAKSIDTNYQVEQLIQMYLVCGIEKLIIQKKAQSSQDPLKYMEKDKEDQEPNEFYVNNFENSYKAHMEKQFQAYQSVWIQNNNTPSYVDEAIQQLEIEDDILKKYCPFSTQVLINAIQDIAIINMAQHLANLESSGFQKMIVQKKYNEIKAIYKLFSRITKKYIEENNNSIDKIKQENNQNKEKLDSELDKEEKDYMEELQKIQNNQKESKEQKELLTKNQAQIHESKVLELKNSHQEKALPPLLVYPIKHLTDVLKKYIQNEGSNFNKDIEITKGCQPYYTKLFEFKEEIDKIIEKYCDKDYDLVSGRDEGFKSFLNAFDKSEEYLAKFCDFFLNKDSGQNLPQEEKVYYIKHVESFVYYLNQKDKFFEVYEKYLSNRLLGKKVCDSDQERQIISCFKKEFVGNKVTNLGKMLQESEQDYSKENESFHKFLDNMQKNLELGKEFTVSILSKVNWPITSKELGEDQQQLINKVHDSTLQAHIDAYIDFYKRNNPQKKLTFYQQEGEVQIKILYTKQSCTLVGTTKHLIFLYAFNEKDEWKVSEIRDLTNFQKQTIFEIVKELNKKKIVKLDPPVKSREDKITGETIIKLNLGFKTDKRRIALNVVRRVEDRSVETGGKFLEDRKNVLDANIVKVMKMRRIATQNDLTAEVINLTKLFKANPPMIKKQIEGLIDKDYLKRDKDDYKKLVYIP